MKAEIRRWLSVLGWLMLMFIAACLTAAGVKAAPDSASHSQNATLWIWDDDQTICDTFTVPPDVTLKVNPGVTVRFGALGKLLVNGRIEATSVTFTSAEQLHLRIGPIEFEFGQPCDGALGQWKGIQVLGPSSSIIFDKVTVRNAERPIHVKESAQENDKIIRNSRVPNALGGCWSEHPGEFGEPRDCDTLSTIGASFIALDDTSDAVVEGNVLGIPSSATSYYGILLQRVHTSSINNNVVYPARRDGIVLNDKSTHNIISRNRVVGMSGAPWECYYVVSLSNNNTFTYNSAVECGGGLDLWGVTDNHFSYFTFKNTRTTGEGGVTLCGVLATPEAPGRSNHFDHIYFDGWEPGARLFNPKDCNEMPICFSSGETHALTLTFGVFRNKGIAVLFNPTGTDYAFHGLGEDERRLLSDLPFVVGDVDGNGLDDILVPDNEGNPNIPGDRYDMDVLFNRGAGGLERAGCRWSVPWADTANLRFADYNGDGMVDVLAQTAEEGKAEVALSSGTYGFSQLTPHWEIPWLDFAALHFHDFTGDGKVDVLAPKPDQDNAEFGQSNGNYGFLQTVDWDVPDVPSDLLRFANFIKVDDDDRAIDVIAWLEGESRGRVSMSSENYGFTDLPNGGYFVLPSDRFSQLRFYDENADGLADVAMNRPDRIDVYYNTGSNFATTPSISYRTIRP